MFDDNRAIYLYIVAFAVCGDDVCLRLADPDGRIFNIGLNQLRIHAWICEHQIFYELLASSFWWTNKNFAGGGRNEYELEGRGQIAATCR